MFSLCDLPDEILLEVVCSFGAIRSHETQSTAFKNKKIEKGRQHQNNTRRQALHALCLTSHRLRRLSLPILYSSSITCATSSGLRSLQLLYRTITSPNNALGQTKRLSEHLQYVENRLADFKGNSLQDDETFQQVPVTDYFQLLAGLVLLAPNIEHICVVSLEHEYVSFWTYILDTFQRSIIRNGPSKLKYLLAQIHANEWTTSPDISVSERIIQHLRSFPVLRDLRLSGAITSRAQTLPLVPSKTLDLRRLDLTENTLDTDDVADLLLACKAIRHFTCKWAFYNDAYVDPSSLHAALLTHANTLETLKMDWREVRFLLGNDANVRLLGSLRSLKALRSLEVSDLGFLSTDHSLLDSPDTMLDRPLCALLPESLEQMTLLTGANTDLFHNDILEDAVCLWQLTRDCKISMPHLRALYVEAHCELAVPTLAYAFERAGVILHVQKQI